MTQTMYKFGQGLDTGMFDSTIVGGKGAKLAKMGSLGLPVPPGVTITTDQCGAYADAHSQHDFIADLVDATLTEFESIAESIGYMPLVSVRSGARVSMPGMMDTILNVGINDENLEEWATRLGSEDAALDCYRRLIEMYSEVVVGIPAEMFEIPDGAYKHSDVIQSHLDTYKNLTGDYFPQAMEEQLAGAIAAVFASWDSERATAYRAMHGYPSEWGTAVTIQQMVFGNRNKNSASGVLFSRDFNTGQDNVIVDWLPQAQGEDVVAGTHTPLTKHKLAVWNSEVYVNLLTYAKQLEKHFRDMQDIEFTVDSGTLYILQTRDGKRSAAAAFKIAYDLHNEGMLSKKEALQRVTGVQYSTLTNPVIDPSYKVAPDIIGEPAAGNLVTGIAVLTSADAVKCKQDCILVSHETNPTDFPGMAKAVGVLTRTGGITCHAAVVARGMDKTCVVGAVDVDLSNIEGKMVTLDGSTGQVWVDKDVPILVGTVPEFVEEMVSWGLGSDAPLVTVTPESVPKEGLVYIDMSGCLGTAKALTAALKGLKTRGGEGIIGFGNTDEFLECDTQFLEFFGVDPRTYPDMVYIQIAASLSKKIWTKKFKKSYVLHLPIGTPDIVQEKLQAAGWSFVTTITSFKSALTANGYIVLDPSFTAQLVRENVDFQDIKELLVKGGRECVDLPQRVNKKRLMFDVLGG